MILFSWPTLHPLSKLLAIQDHAQNLEEQLLMDWGEEGGEHYIAQKCDLKWFELRKAGFSLECLNIIATGYTAAAYTVLILPQRFVHVMLIKGMNH